MQIKTIKVNLARIKKDFFAAVKQLSFSTKNQEKNSFNFASHGKILSIYNDLLC
jgi:predicted transcriptional regulator